MTNRTISQLIEASTVHGHRHPEPMSVSYDEWVTVWTQFGFMYPEADVLTAPLMLNGTRLRCPERSLPRAPRPPVEDKTPFWFTAEIRTVANGYWVAESRSPNSVRDASDVYVFSDFPTAQAFLHRALTPKDKRPVFA